jgi:hypothetical protein
MDLFGESLIGGWTTFLIVYTDAEIERTNFERTKEIAERRVL